MKKYLSLDDLPSSLTVLDMASYLGISRTHAYKIINQMNIPRLKLGERIIIPKDLFIEWVRNESLKVDNEVKFKN